MKYRQSRGLQLSQHAAKFVVWVSSFSSQRISEAMSEMGQRRRGRLVSSKSWKALVTSGVVCFSVSIRFDRSVVFSRDSHESADPSEQALSTVAPVGTTFRRTCLQRTTSRIVPVCSAACSVQGNGRRGVFHLLFFPVTEHKVLEYLSCRP